MTGRIRTIKPEFFRSPSTAKASYPARILFQAMWCWADDHGIGETNLYGLLGFAFCDEDQISISELQSLLSEVADAYGVVFYTVRGRHFYAIPSWNAHQKTQRRAARRNPTPDDPESRADQRIYGHLETSDVPQGTSEATRGNVGSGTGEQGNRGTGEPPTPSRAETSLALVPANAGGDVAARLNATARSAPAHQIAKAFSESLPTPLEGGMLAKVGVEIDKCLTAGIPSAAIAEGLQAWTDSDSWSPTQIPNFVHKANSRGKRHRGRAKPTEKAVDAMAVAEQMIREGLTNGR